MTITWEEPPKNSARHGKGTDWSEIAEKLRTRPNTWALVREDVTPATANQIKKGLLGGMAAGEFEARSSGIGMPKGRAKIYARYVGEANA